jgi:prophage DNA circulation protein
MSNADLQNLQECSFRGVSFLYKSGTKEFGRKYQAHEYPNKRERFIEDLGELDDKFTITAIITGPNYFEKRNALERALRQEGPGQLIHPFYGPVTVSVTGISAKEDLTRLNVISYDLSFEKTGTETSSPKETIAVQPSLLNSSETVSSLIESYIGSNFFISPRYPANFEDSVEQLLGIADQYESILDIRTLTGDISNYSKRLGDFREKITTYINNPITMAQELVGLYTDMQSLPSNGEDQLLLNETFYNFGDSDTFLEEKTLGRIERARNRRILNDSLNALALVNSYEAASNSTYFSTEELNETRDSLENQYDATIERPQIDPNVFEHLSQARVYTREFFKDQEAQAFRINTIQTNKIPMTVLAYQYYGDTDLTENLIELNGITYNPSVEGNIKLYTR